MDIGLDALFERVEEYFGETGVHVMLYLVWTLILLGVLRSGLGLYVALSDEFALGDTAKSIIYLVVLLLLSWVISKVFIRRVERYATSMHDGIDDAHDKLRSRYEECQQMHETCKEWMAKVERKAAELNDDG